MALTELNALDNAYKALEPLDGAGRRRALQWLADALGQGSPLADTAAAAAYDDGLDSGEDGDEPSAASSRGTRRRKSAAQPAVASTRATRGVRKTKATAKAVQRQAASGRAYRRMPDPDTVMKAYGKTGSISALAEHFDVPLHTANHWARRLRGQGYAIGRNS
jgi:hypothetical protein